MEDTPPPVEVDHDVLKSYYCEYKDIVTPVMTTYVDIVQRRLKPVEKSNREELSVEFTAHAYI